MSRIGKKPVAIPSGVKVVLDTGLVRVEGPKGKLQENLVSNVEIALDGTQAVVSRVGDTRASRSNQGLMRSLLANMIVGVEKGYEKILDIKGVGYRAEISGKTLTLHLGYSHPVERVIPDGIEVTVEKNTRVFVRGIDKQAVGQVAAVIRATKDPDPYKVKGVTYAGERIKKKAGKKAVS